MTEIDRHTIEQAAAGDLSAFERIYHFTSGFVYGLALRMVRNPQDASEITQDVFMKVYYKLKDFRFQSSLKTWIYRIAVNTALNARRRLGLRRTRETSMDDNILDLQTAPMTQLPCAEVERKQRLEFLLSRLTPEHKTILLLRETEGLSYQEIADVLKINLNTVRTRLKRARQQLVLLAESGVIRNEM